MYVSACTDKIYKKISFVIKCTYTRKRLFQISRISFKKRKSRFRYIIPKRNLSRRYSLGSTRPINIKPYNQNKHPNPFMIRRWTLIIPFISDLQVLWVLVAFIHSWHQRTSPSAALHSPISHLLDDQGLIHWRDQRASASRTPRTPELREPLSTQPRPYLQQAHCQGPFHSRVQKASDN